MAEHRTLALVDLDDTLLRYRVEESAAQAALANAMGFAVSSVWLDSYRWAKDAERQQPQNGVDRLERRIRILATVLDLEMTIEDVARMRRIYVDARVGAVSPLPGARALVDHLRATFDVLLICTIGIHDLQVARLQASGLDRKFDDILVSDARQVGKEDWPAFLGDWFDPSWRYAAISDREVPDLEEARSAGMFTVGIGAVPSAACDLHAEDPAALNRMFEHAALADRMERHYRREADS